MAAEQLSRNKKKTLLTMMSLATSLTVFICLITLLHTQSAREYNYNYMGLDMVIKNDTIQNVLVRKKTRIPSRFKVQSELLVTIF